jgi:hypothetical protein
MPEPCPRATQLWDVPCPDPPPGLSCPSYSSGGTGLWVGTLNPHWRSCGAHSQTTRRSHHRSRIESQIERSLRRSGRCLTWLWSASLSCSAGPAPCTRDESVSARFAVGVGCTAAGASGWPTLAPSLEPDPASPCDCGWSCKLGLSKGGVFSEHIFAAHLRIPRPQGRVSSVRAAAVQAQWSPPRVPSASNGVRPVSV